MSTPRKTADEMLNDSYIRSDKEPITAYEFNETHMMVFNENSNGEYLVEIDFDNQVVVDCTCPHRAYRVGPINIPCKHMIKVAELLGYRF